MATCGWPSPCGCSGKYDEAEKLLVRPLLAAYPTEVLALTERAMLDVACNRRDAARAELADILMLDPGNALAKEQLKGP